MASIAIAASMQRTCSSHQVKKKQWPQPKQPVLSAETNKVNNKNVVTLNIEGQNGSYLAEQAENSASHICKSENGEDAIESACPRFLDERWKNGTWDLNVCETWEDRLGWCYCCRASCDGGIFNGISNRCVNKARHGWSVRKLCMQAGVFVTVVGVILFRRTGDLNNLRKLADEATFYDKQWQSSWQDHKANIGTHGKKH